MPVKFLMLLCFFLISVSSFSQDDDNSIENQFINVIDKSNNYKEYKVIKKSEIEVLRQNVIDSIEALDADIIYLQGEIEKQKSEIELLTQNLNATKSNLATSIEKESGIEVFGIVTQKATYNAVLWSIIIGLITILGFVFYRYKNSNAITKSTLSKLSDVEASFDSHRKKTLVNEQLLRRKLQDEINKNRNV